MELKRLIPDLEACDGMDWAAALGLPPHVMPLLDNRIRFIYADGSQGRDGRYYGAERSEVWHSANLSLGALFWLTSQQDEDAKKDHAGIALMTQKTGERTRRQHVAASWTGLALDDDNHKELGRGVTVTNTGPIRVAFSTASDGKDAASNEMAAFGKWAKEVANGLSFTKADDATIARFLNALKDGEPFRSVKVKRYEGGTPMVRDGGLFDYTMEAHTRTRTIVPFAEPITGELLTEIQRLRLVRKVCDAIEHDICGRNGHDEKTKTVNAVAYLPAKCKAPFFHTVCGDLERPYLYDAKATAERILAENPPRPRTEYVPKKTGGKVTGLRGLLLATFIAEQVPDLQQGSKTFPLVLKRCPFADFHGSRQGQADGSAFVYDADEHDNEGWPHIGCQHDSCKKRMTLDFVREMISRGELPSSIYEDQAYRIEVSGE
jgi:hypothetical protein